MDSDSLTGKVIGCAIEVHRRGIAEKWDGAIWGDCSGESAFFDIGIDIAIELASQLETIVIPPPHSIPMPIPNLTRNGRGRRVVAILGLILSALCVLSG